MPYSQVRTQTLKRRITGIIFICTLIPIILLGLSSYYTIHAILNNKIASGIQNTLHQIRKNMENVFDGLNSASQQLVYTGRIGSNLQSYLTDVNIVDRYHDQLEISENLRLIAYSNPNLGLFFYYSPAKKEIMFQNKDVSPGFTPDRLTPLNPQYGLAIQAPHPSGSIDKATVFSLVRPVDLTGKSDLLVYIESDPDTFRSLLNSSQYGMRIDHIIVDSRGKVVYSGDSGAFPVGSSYHFKHANGFYRSESGSYVFEDRSESQGWGLVAVVPKSALLHETSGWAMRSMIITAGSLVISLLLGWSLRLTVLLPLGDLNRQIKFLGNSQFDAVISPTHIAEFDYVLHQFGVMRHHISELMDEIKRQEQDKHDLAVEKLAAQINPHFLYNTLNTIQWLARSKGNEDIVGLVAVFVRLLRYNLGKDGNMVTIRQELSALNDYVKLQAIRYDYVFSVDVQADEAVLDSLVPRFILQPLIENALYHGALEDGDRIAVTVGVQDHFAVFTVSDEGAGMTEQKIASLIGEKPSDRDRTGMGIGLHYVMTMLRVHYMQEAKLSISSEAGLGTIITIRIPIRKERRHAD